MATYKIKGTRFLRKYTASKTTLSYMALSDAELIASKLCDVPWEKTDVISATFPAHSGLSEDSDKENVAMRDEFDAALFCAEHKNNRHRAYANAACYRFVLPESAVGISLTSFKTKVFCDPYNANGARVSLFLSDSETPPTDCTSCRNGYLDSTLSSEQSNNGTETSAATEWYSDNTHVEGVAPRRALNGNWYGNSGYAIIRPTGGLPLKKYLYVFVLLENYAVARNGFLEGAVYADPVFELETTSEIESWSSEVVVDLSMASGGGVDLTFWNVDSGAVGLASKHYEEVYAVKVFGYENVPLNDVSNLRTAALVAYREDNRVYIDLVTPQETKLISDKTTIADYLLNDGDSVVVSLGFDHRAYASLGHQVILGNDSDMRILCPAVVLTADGFVKRGSRGSYFELKMSNGVPRIIPLAFSSWAAITNQSIALPNRSYGTFFGGRLSCDKDGKVLYLYQDSCDRCRGIMKTIDVSGKISGIFECISDSVDVLSSENPTCMTSIIVAGDFSAINGVPAHNFALITLANNQNELGDITIKPLFDSTVSLDVYDDINILPLYSAKNTGFLRDADGRNMTAFMIFGQFKKANGIDVDGCVFATRTGTVVRPALKKINNAIGVFFESYCSTSRDGHATLNKFITLEKR